jgi:hypothetical protein
MRFLTATLYHWITNKWCALIVVFILGTVLRFIFLADIPRGYYHDDAWTAATAMALIRGEQPLRIYFADNNGMDSLHIYLVALLYLFTGPIAVGPRIVTALASALTIPATYWAASELLIEERHRHALAIVSAFIISTLFGALTVSRSGLSATTMVLTVTLSLAALFRGRRLQKPVWFVVSGVVAGLAQYVVQSARFLPLLLAAIALMDLWGNSARLRPIFFRYVLLVVAAIVAFAPLGYYFIYDPASVFHRAQQTMIDLDPSSLLQSVWRTLQSVSIRSSEDMLHNLPYRPLLDPILSSFFVIGLGVCIARRRPVHVILIAWLIVFSLPFTLTYAAVFRRWAGVGPAVAMVCAFGVVALVEFLRDRGSHVLRLAGLLSVAILLVASACISVITYFGPYASNPDMFFAYDAGITAAAQYIRDHPDLSILLTPFDKHYEVITIVLAQGRRSPIQSFNGNYCTLFPQMTTQETEWMVITDKDKRTLAIVQRLFPGGQITWSLDSPIGAYARAYRVPAQQTAQLPFPYRRWASFSKIQLVGFNVPPSVRVGNLLHVTTALQDVTPLGRPYKIFLHLYGSDGTLVAQDDRLPCQFTLNEADWRPGDIVLEQYDLPISDKTPKGEYRLALGLYTSETGERMQVTEADLAQDADRVLLGTVQVK